MEYNQIKQHSMSNFILLENEKHDLKITTSLDRRVLGIQSIPKFVKYDQMTQTHMLQEFQLSGEIISKSKG